MLGLGIVLDHYSVSQNNVSAATWTVCMYRSQKNIYRVGRFDGVRRTERVQSTSETRTAYRTSVSEGV